MTEILTAADLEQLAGQGISPSEARRQFELLQGPPATICIDRPASLGDGIRTIDEVEFAELLDLSRECALGGRLSKFVPASGAAPRMFEAARQILESGIQTRDELQARVDAGDGTAGEVLCMLDEAPRLPFPASFISAATDASTPVVVALAHLLGEADLGYATQAKGLIPFHRYNSSSRTAFEEHLIEGSRFLADQQGRCHFHFTVSKAHQAAFRALAASLSGGDLEISFSTQSTASNTLALEIDGPARTDDGRLRLRPGGHGALLANLERTGADLVLIKNIDNIVPESDQAEGIEWQRVLLGLLAREQQRAIDCIRSLRDSGSSRALAEAEAFCRNVLRRQIQAPGNEQRRLEVLEALSRPFRVCGMVRNQGEPGGGPFWVRAGDGSLSLQIVESAQVDHRDPKQAESWGSSTHFNPVLMAVGLRDPDRRPCPLAEFVDPGTAFLSEKQVSGRPVRVLEHPGLWNGAMAYWNTLFVEVPLATFAPVKTVLDLLRPEHQAG